MTDSTFIPRFFFGSDYQIVIGIDTLSGEIFFLREGEEVSYKDTYDEVKNWDSKVKEIAKKLLLSSKESFNDLLKEAKLGNPNRPEALLLESVKEE